MTKLRRAPKPIYLNPQQTGTYKEKKKRNGKKLQTFSRCSLLPLRTDLFSFSIRKNGTDGSTTAECIMIYLWSADGWCIFGAIENIYFCTRPLNGIRYVYYARRNPIYSGSFYIPSNLCLCHSRFTYIRHQTTFQWIREFRVYT